MQPISVPVNGSKMSEETELTREIGLPEKPLTLSDVGGCTCQRFDAEAGKHTYGSVLDRHRRSVRRRLACRYHQGAAQQPWNHRIPWNCPTYWDGCNCEGGPYFYEAKADPT